MPARPKAFNKRVLSPGLLGAVKACSMVALLDAAYLASISFTEGALPGCGPNSSCQELLASRWAYFLGLPVSFIAVLAYGIFFIAACRVNARCAAAQLRRTWAVLVSCSCVIILAAIWFVCLQLFVIKRICPFCMAAHACAAMAAGLILFLAPIRVAPSKTWQTQKEVFIEPAKVKIIALLALLGIATLILGQTLHQPLTYSVKKVVPSGAAGSKAQAARLFPVYQGKFELNLDDEPLMGRSTAPHVIVSLFDYTCPHCRATHDYLKQAQARFSNELAIVNLVMPLDGACNSAIKQTRPLHANACEYARIGLAVWRADKRAAEKFDDWLFGPASPPSMSEAREYASKLVGPEMLARVGKEEWINAKIKRNVAIYQLSYLEDRRGMMPQLIIGEAFVAGPPNQAADLFRIIGQEFGLLSGR